MSQEKTLALQDRPEIKPLATTVNPIQGALALAHQGPTTLETAAHALRVGRNGQTQRVLDLEHKAVKKTPGPSKQMVRPKHQGPTPFTTKITNLERMPI